MAENEPYGVTPEERNLLTGSPEPVEELDLKASLLAFVCLFLICVMMIVASLIARSRPEENAQVFSPDPSGNFQGDVSTEKPHTRRPDPDTDFLDENNHP